MTEVETDAHITLVDRHGAPGGHWNDAYPFVTLHQPSAFLSAAIADGVGVRGYVHWSLLDNVVEVDRRTFVRTPKPSLAWLGGVAQANAV